ncbi:MAG: hypothetical protein WC913_01420, partial [Desulfuromonas sp.]
RYFEDQGYQKLLAMLTDMSSPPAQVPTDDEEPTPGSDAGVREPKVEYVHYRQVPVSYDKAWLANENDVDRFLESMRKALIADIQKGKRIQV